MVEYFENLYFITPTGIENLLLFHFGKFINAYEIRMPKVSLFDLNTRTIIKDYNYDDGKGGLNGRCNGNWFSFEKNPEESHLIDLSQLKTIHIFNARELLDKHLLAKKYKSSEYKIEGLSMINAGITPEIIIQLISYEIHSAQSGELISEKRAFLGFDPSTFEYIGRCPYSLYNKISNNVSYPYTVYNRKKLDVALSTLNIERRLAQGCEAFYDKILHFTTNDGELIEGEIVTPEFFNKKYNVLAVRLLPQAVLFYFDKDYDIDKAFEEAEEKAKQAALSSTPKNRRYDLDLPDEEIFKQSGFNIETFIRERGLTESVFANFPDGEIFNGGSLWASDIIEEKEKESGLSDLQLLESSETSNDVSVLYSIGLFDTITNADGLDYYLLEYEEHCDTLLKALNTVGAVKTVKLFQKALKIKEQWLDKDEIKMAEKLDSVCDEILDGDSSDYVEKTVAYIKKLKNFEVKK